MKYLILFFWVCWFVGCGSQQHCRVDLSDARTLESGNLLYEATDAGILTELEIQDSLLIVLDDLGEKKFIVLDLFSGKERMKCGDKGRGPGEFFSPEFLRNNQVRGDHSGALKLYDNNTFCFYEIDFNKWLYGATGAVQVEKMPRHLEVNCELNLFRDKIIGENAGQSDSGMIAVYDRKTDRQEWIGYYPQKGMVRKGLYSYVYDLHLTANEQTDRLIGGMTFADLIQVYDTRGKLHRTYQFSDSDAPDIDSQTQMINFKSPIYFGGCYAGQNYCYFLRIGYVSSNAEERKKGTHLIQLDWKGNLVATYKLNDYLYGFCVDETRNKLLGIVSEDGDIYRILEYRL